MNAGEGVEKRESSYTAGGNVNQNKPYGEQYGGFLNKNRATILSSSPTPGHIFRKNKNSKAKRYMHPNNYSSTIYNSQDKAAT